MNLGVTQGCIHMCTVVACCVSTTVKGLWWKVRGGRVSKFNVMFIAIMNLGVTQGCIHIICFLCHHNCGRSLVEGYCVSVQVWHVHGSRATTTVEVIVCQYKCGMSMGQGPAQLWNFSGFWCVSIIVAGPLFYAYQTQCHIYCDLSL
jgi:heme/copper-type cytochrome/quinol oxidase subunit 4